MKSLITADGRIFEEDNLKYGTYKEKGGKGAEVTAQEIKNYDKYTGTKTVNLKDSGKSHPYFTEMMIEKSKL